MVTSFGHETPLWEPGEELKQQANMTKYMQWLEREKGLSFHTRSELWEWSVNKLEISGLHCGNIFISRHQSGLPLRW